jgi:nitroimidazol reductase NimA-like FMN-containing flavoprotein (pyridoxamine 5'-phosphate oxidase superfamily)
MSTVQQPATRSSAILALEFLRQHDIAVLSTSNRAGQVHGAAVHYVVTTNGAVYILTKGGTQKAHNMLATHRAALTVYDDARLQTVQLQGRAEIESRQEVKDRVFEALARPRQYDGERHLPPVTELHEGAFTAFRIKPETVRFIDFSTAE